MHFAYFLKIEIFKKLNFVLKESVGIAKAWQQKMDLSWTPIKRYASELIELHTDLCMLDEMALKPLLAVAFMFGFLNTPGFVL